MCPIQQARIGGIPVTGKHVIRDIAMTDIGNRDDEIRRAMLQRVGREECEHGLGMFEMLDDIEQEIRFRTGNGVKRRCEPRQIGNIASVIVDLTLIE